ncbi:MAG TPA: flagellar basal-body rod protein FlgF [Mariprofundaceae bacterium]|nr:flagellar basal-body rod protein FlgF [Mariprofundaceae bacterium]
MQLGFYVAGVSGSDVDRELSTLTNNIANANTVGYKADRTSFATSLAKQINGAAALSQGAPAFAGTGEQYVDLRTGALTATGNPLDFGIRGDGYFRVRLPDGSEAYTRAGNFQMNAQGELTTADGKLVLNDGGQPITLPRKGHISVDTDGTITVHVRGRTTQTKVGKIGLAQIIDPRQVRKKAGVLLTTPPGNVKGADSSVKVMQGYTETSNVNSVQEMTQLMSVQRNFDSMMKIVSQYSQQMDLLNQQVGQIK